MLPVFLCPGGFAIPITTSIIAIFRRVVPIRNRVHFICFKCFFVIDVFVVVVVVAAVTRLMLIFPLFVLLVIGLLPKHAKNNSSFFVRASIVQRNPSDGSDSDVNEKSLKLLDRDQLGAN